MNPEGTWMEMTLQHIEFSKFGKYEKLLFLNTKNYSFLYLLHVSY
jgi:hypothetical protein